MNKARREKRFREQFRAQNVWRKPGEHKELEMPKRAEAEAKVRCNGKMHLIVFDNGHLTLKDHPDPAREMALFEFGGRCRCLEVLEAWKKRVRKLLPQPLLKAYDRWRYARWLLRRSDKLAATEVSARNVRKNIDKVYLLKDRDEQVAAARARIRHGLEACMPRTAYQEAGEGLLCLYLGAPDISRKKKERHIETKVTVGEGWANAVLAKGMAVIDGHLTLAVLTEEYVAAWLRRKRERPGSPPPWWVAAFGDSPDLSKGPYVLAGVPGRGCSVYPWPARVVETAEGRVLELYKPGKARPKTKGEDEQ